MQILTYKDLKALYKPEVRLQLKALTDFFYLTLCEAMPILTDDIDWFLKFLETESKQSLDARDEKGFLRGDAFTWNDKYLNLSNEYSKLNRKFRFVIRQWIMEEDDDKPIEQFDMVKWLAFVRDMAKEFRNSIDSHSKKDIFEITDWLCNSDEKEAIRLKNFIELSFASTFNHISLIQNKAKITSLLKSALRGGPIENFKKIFAVDPSVYDLAEVQNFINSQDRKTKAEINGYYSESIDIPIISNQKNQISQKPMFIIGILDSMDVINGKISFSKTRLLNLGTLAGIDHDSIDQGYFNKLLIHVKD
ncbi:hypothetical protein [Thiomicrorhabdus indica]|uniref:hypothetical protein n=1 Tax=Thiomicrorhabdus indica TaxID=2267253 RepID=UPI002AA71EA6|nr:hypothetical protein [Thiomicrorhabdus indica]